MTFEEILPAVKSGKKARRQIWARMPPHSSTVLELVHPSVPDGRQVMPILMLEYQGVLRPFGGAIWDLLADDWEVL